MPGQDKKRSRTLKVIGIVLLVLLAAIVALPFFLDVNQFKPELESKLSGALGREVRVGKLKLSPLSGSVAVEEINIADNPSFSHSPFVNAQSLKMGIELKPLIFSKSVRITGIVLDHPSITLIRSASGQWNFSDLGSGSEPKAPGSGQSGSSSGKDVSIQQLKITGGQITVVNGQERQKPAVYNNVDIAASNLSYTTAFPFSLTASMPGQGTLKLEGKAGPLPRQDMLMTPMSAELVVKHFDLVASGFVEPGSGLAGLIDFSGTVTSDGGQVRSKGKASADKLRIVKSGSPAGKPVSLQYSVSYDLAGQNGSLSDATIGYGKAVARLNGNYEMRGSNLILKMTLHGNNMPVQDMTALLPALGITLPRGASLQGGFLNSDLATEGPIEGLIIAGTVEISNTRLAGFDLSGKMAPIAAMAGLRSSQETDIEKFASALRLAPDGIQVSNLVLVAPALGELSGNGRIAADQSLDFTMQAMLKPSGALGAGLGRLVKGGTLNVPFFVRGTASEPKFVPDMKKAAGGLLGSALGQGNQGSQSDTGKALGDTLRNLFKKKK